MGNYDAAGGAAIGVIYLLLQFVPQIIGIVCYIFSSLGLYTIAQRRGISNPWLAWIPFGNVWILGSISDQYQQVVKNKKTNRRKVLLWLEIAAIVVTVILVIVFVVFIFQIAMTDGGTYSEFGYGFTSYAADSEVEIVGLVLTFVIVFLLMWLAIMAVAIVDMVFLYMSYYDLYASCDPKNATTYLVLSIVLGFLTPFLVFAVRNKDFGMQPALPQWGSPAGYQPPQQPYGYQPPVQPYQPPVTPVQPPVQPAQPPVQFAQPPEQIYQPPVQAPPEDDTQSNT